MTKEELLQEAKLRYPVGTKFKVVHQPDKIRTVKSHNYFDNTFVCYGRDVAINLLIKEIGGTMGATVYSNGKWAEIIEHSQLLGETEKYKAGDWVVITAWQGGSDEGSVVKLIQAGQCLTYKNDIGIVLSASPECVRPARPEEIPQEEVEFVECTKVDDERKLIIGGIYKLNAKATDNGSYYQLDPKHGDRQVCYYKTRFKPSTREAYEAQQRKQKCIEAFSEVNKCSTINTNQNECKNENKSIKVRGSSISISTVSRARGKSLCSSGGKVSLGTYYSRNKQKPCNSKA